MRRYKYLEKMFEEEMKKVLVFIKGFQPEERIKLARMTALWIGMYLHLKKKIIITLPCTFGKHYQYNLKLNIDDL